MKKRAISLLLIVILLTSILVGCSSNEELPKEDEKLENQEEETKEEENKKGEDTEKVLNVTLSSEPDSLDVSKASDLNSQAILTQVMENLTRLEVDENGNDVVVEAMAKSWDVSEDGLEWTFHLRDAKWSDGEDVTAEDFVYGVERTIDPETASPVATLLDPIKNARAIIEGEKDVEEIGIEAVDEKTVKIELEYPCAHFLDLTYDRVMQPQRKDIVEKFGNAYGTEAENLVFNGPFVIDNWVHNSEFNLSKNENYWDKDSVHIDELNIKIIEDETALMGEFQNGDIDLVRVSSAEWVEELDKSDKFDKIEGYEARTAYLFFNQQVDVFSNPKLRQAFSIALDREEIQEQIQQNMNGVAYGWVPPSIDIGDVNFRKAVGEPIQELIDENPDPRALFEEGLKEAGIDKAPEEITIEFMVPNNESKEFPEYLQQQFKEKLGVNVELDFAEWPVFQERNRQLDYEMGFKSKGGYYNDPMTMLDIWISEAKIIPTGWNNERYDELIDLASKSIDNEERLEYFKEAERLLVKDDCTIAPYSYNMKRIYMQKNIEGIMSPAFGPILYKYIDFK